MKSFWTAFDCYQLDSPLLVVLHIIIQIKGEAFKKKSQVIPAIISIFNNKLFTRSCIIILKLGIWMLVYWVQWAYLRLECSIIWISFIWPWNKVTIVYLILIAKLSPSPSSIGAELALFSAQPQLVSIFSS